MDSFQPNAWLTIITLVVAGTTFILGIKHSLNNAIRDKHDALTAKIHALELEMKNLDKQQLLQEQIIRQITTQLLSKLPELYSLIEAKKNGDK